MSLTNRPESFGPFAVRADLGASRFGPVYLGRDPSTNARVVIRTFGLSEEARGFVEQSELLDSFRKLCATTFDHPGLARPLAFGAEGDIPYLVYAFLPGTPMDVVMRQDGVRPVAEVLQRATQLAAAIDSAAGAGVHHGMMAPCDVILEGDRTGVTGFGLAQALIKVGMPAEAGSPYGSPQRLAGAPPTLADDVYSLAAISLELLIGAPTDPNHETYRALRDSQGLPERRRVPRPAPYETRLFTTLAGVDAGKLRAALAAAFSDDPGERPSTASEFVASFRDAVSNRRPTDQPTSSAAVLFDSEEPDTPPSIPVLHMDSLEGGPTGLELPFRQERVAPERQETIATEPLIREAHKHELRERGPEIRPARTEPVFSEALLADVRPPFASLVDEPAYAIPVQSGSRALVVVGAVAVSLAAGFAGGFVVGQRSKPLAESTGVSHQESVIDPQPSPVAGEDPKPVAATTQTLGPNSEEKVSSPEPIADVSPAQQQPEPPDAAPAREPATPAVEHGRLLVRSTPEGAAVVVDGQSRGVTPLALRNLALGEHSIEVAHPGLEARQQRVRLTERRPSRSIDFELRSAGGSSQFATAANLPGSLQVSSRPTGAQVFVDDNLVGTTPLLLPNVTAGARRVRLELSGYKIWTLMVQIEPSERFRVSASLEP